MMAAAPRFDDLALKYVLADEDESRREISEQAAIDIEESTSKRAALGQWVASVSRWLQSSGDEDLISRAKALEFLASTLQVISRNNDAALNADQVGLLVKFFSSLLENDHKAGVTASAKALRHLIVMKHFLPTLGNEIIENVCKLKDDFKLQAPATRLELYHLVESLLNSPAVASDLESRHGNTCGFMKNLLDLCRFERDPENLMMWFEIMGSFLQGFNPSADVSAEVFKAFSAYFPISLRPSATPTAVTTDTLKLALRSCFSAHHRTGSHSIPFLVEKLDRVDQTVAVKVDILLTLDACLIMYDSPKQSIAPYADQIWSSLKYEVRNGEIQDIIKATLNVLCSLTKRLDGDDLQSFLSNAWRDLKEDILDSNYAAQAGRLLIAVVAASPHSFALLMPRALEHIKQTIKHNTSVLHKRHLITLMSSIVRLRLHLVSDAEFNLSQSNDGAILLSDDLFGDSLFHELYLPFWEEHSVASSPIENIGILREAMQGLGALVGQKSSGKASVRRLCSDSTCQTIFQLLAKPVIICPLEGTKYFDSVNELIPQDLLDAGEEALRNAVPLYPPSFPYLLLQYLTSVKAAYQHHTQQHDLALRIRGVSATLCAVSHSDNSDPDACWLNEAALINTLLQGLQWMLSEQADPTFLVVFIDAIHVTLVQSLKQSSKWDNSPKLTKELFGDIARGFDALDVPRVDLDRLGKIEALEHEKKGPERPRRAYCLFVVQQLYRRFTNVTYKPTDEVGYSTVILDEHIFATDPLLSPKQDLLVSQLGQMATTVVRALDEDEQKSFELDREGLHLFHPYGTESATLLTLPLRLSDGNEFRMAPLTLGIMQGLWPGAIRTEIHHIALNDVTAALIATPTLCSQAARAALDTLLCVLANKFVVKKNPLLIAHRLEAQLPLIRILQGALGQNQIPNNTTWKLQIFRSVLHYLAGDIARLHTGLGQNPLLSLVIDNGPTDVMMGRQLAQNLGLLVMPRDCLSDLNHATRRKLSLGWLYSYAIHPLFDRCFRGLGVEEREATNRSVGLFSILKHLDYTHYSADIDLVVRIAMRSLSTFKVGVETESLLTVLLYILEKDPAELRGHLAALIQRLTAIYEMARNVADAAQFDPLTMSGIGGKKPKDYPTKTSGINARDRDPIATRMLTLQFFYELTQGAYDAHLLLPHRGALLRPLAAACGDSVREIRRTALKARKAWEGLD